MGCFKQIKSQSDAVFVWALSPQGWRVGGPQPQILCCLLSFMWSVEGLCVYHTNPLTDENALKAADGPQSKEREAAEELQWLIH